MWIAADLFSLETRLKKKIDKDWSRRGKIISCYYIRIIMFYLPWALRYLHFYL